MAWFRRRPAAPGRADNEAHRAGFDHLDNFVQTRRGVEGLLEPQTTVTQVTLLLVAHDGEWTRRRVPSVAAARNWCHQRNVPVYDVALVGYPQRMRDYNERRKQAEAGGQLPAG